MGSWRLPTEVVEGVATDIRRLARLLWTLHLNFEQVRGWGGCPAEARGE
jgi:hypothetical protein